MGIDTKNIAKLFREFDPCDGCEFWGTLEDRSPSLKRDVGRAVIELHSAVQRDQVWGNEINPVERASDMLEKHDLDQEDIDQVAMARCVLRQLVVPKEVDVVVSAEYL